MRKRGLLRRSLGWLAGVIATVLIVLAVVVGVVRLLLPLVPDYQDDIRRFAIQATGFDVSFGLLSASWPLSGPELRFSSVRIATLTDHRPVLDADELSVGVNLWRLLAERRLRPTRVAVKGASVRAEHLPSGEWVVNGVPLEQLLNRPPNEPLPRLDLRVEDIAFLLLDTSRLEPRVALTIEQLTLELSPERIGFSAELNGQGGLGSGLEVSGSLPPALLPARAGAKPREVPETVVWDLRAAGADLDVARWLRIVANEAVPLTSGRGDVELQASLAGLRPTACTLELDLGPSTWSGVATADNNFERLELQAGWAADSGGWEATLAKFVVKRGGKTSPASTGTIRYALPADASPTLSVSADDLRLQDIWPLLRSVASPGARRELLPERLQGQVRDLQFSAALPAGQAPSWSADAVFEDLGLVMPAPGFAVTGVTGRVRGDQSGGQVRLAARDGLVRLPAIFRSDIAATTATGQLGWKHTERGLELLGDDLRLTTPDGEAQSRFRLIFPPAGPVFVDLALRFVATSAPAALNYAPLVKMRPAVVKWLDRAFVAGSVPRGQLLWQGAVRGFPYEAGDGRFRLEFTLADAVIDYADDWPRVENASGTVIIDRVGLTSVENRGSIGGIPFEDAEISVPNLVRDEVLNIAAADQVQLGQILGFLRQTPVSALLGPTLESVTGGGNVATAIDLQLPIASPKDYRLLGTFALEGARLGLKGVDFGLTSLEGTVRLDTDRLAAERLVGRFLDEPVSIALRAAGADEEGLSQVAELTGETPAEKLAAAFSLPYAEKLSGSVAWNASVQLPAQRARRPFTVQISSDLTQAASALAQPLNKLAGTPEPLRMEVKLPERGVLQVSGGIDRGVSWALQFLSAPQIAPGPAPGAGKTPAKERRARSGWRLERGVLRSGPIAAGLPAEPGLEIGGTFASLRFEDWFPGGGSAGSSGESSADLIRRIDIEADSFTVLGRVFPDVELDARRDPAEWRIAVRSPSAEGQVTVPLSQAEDAPILLEMQRLWLPDVDPAGGDRVADPRNLPPVRAAIDDFRLKEMRLGKLTAELVQRGDGVVVEPLILESPTFSITGDATWVVEDSDVSRQRSELRLQLRATQIGPTMEALGYKRVIEGENAAVTVNLFWPGGPGEDFLDAAGGRVVVDLDKGQFLAVDPGGGRIVGLLSIATLPRRLGLDFSDVTEKGLAFDTVKGEFRLDKGNAFTCNFGLAGPAADIGILGRVSLRDRTYDQLAVVRPHVSDMLAVGGFVGGPVVGGTVLLLSQIFRKPLSSFGESYYRLSGSWDEPEIDEVQRSTVDLTPFRNCEKYLAEALKELPPEADLTR